MVLTTKDVFFLGKSNWQKIGKKGLIESAIIVYNNLSKKGGI